jgi:putative transposase
MLNLVNPNPAVRPEDVRLSLDEIAREGARRMLIEALQAEIGEYVEKNKELRDDVGRRLVVRNGRAAARNVTPASDLVPQRALNQ